jgi:hypothetical protein
MLAAFSILVRRCCGLIWVAPILALFLQTAHSFASVKEASVSKGWLALLRYNKSIFGFKSEADDLRFFVAGEQGATNPELELSSFLDLVQERPVDQNHVRCRFPARYRFAQRRGLLPNDSSQIAEELCLDLVAFRKRMNTKAVAIEFSSFYINKPASSFGHTLLRLAKADFLDDQKFQLLDYGLNYSATVTTSNPLAYGVLGIFGGFLGEFQNLQYYYKVREYSDFQSRDMWSYELDFSDQEINDLISHVWEMKQARFKYFYLDENCSYHLLALLDAVKPKLGLKSKMAIFALPTDTIKIINESGLVKKVRFRPSNRRVVQHYLDQLSDRQSTFFNQIVGSKGFALSSLAEAGSEDKAAVLDALISYFDYKFVERVLAEEPEITKLKKKILIARAKTGIRSEALAIVPPDRDRPELSHGSSGFRFSATGSDAIPASYMVSGRFVLHDLMDSSYGLNPYSTMEMGEVGLRVFENKFKGQHAFVDHFQVFELENLNPLNRIDQKLSYRIRLAYRRGSENGCLYCAVSELKFDSGPSIEIERLKLWVMAASRIPYSEDFRNDHLRLDLGGSAGAQYTFSENFKFRVDARYLWGVSDSMLDNYRISSELRWNMTKNQGLGLQYNRVWNEENYSAQLNWHF